MHNGVATQRNQKPKQKNKKSAVSNQKQYSTDILKVEMQKFVSKSKI